MNPPTSVRLPVAAFAVAAALAFAFLGCEGDYVRPSRFRTLGDLDRPDCRIGVWEGHDSERFARKAFPNAAIVPVEEPEDAFVALLAGRMEAFVADEHVLNVGRRAYPLRFRILDTPLEREPAVATLSAKRPDLLADVNRFIADYRRNGTYDAMFARWCLCDRSVGMPQIAAPTNATQELRIGTSGLVEPSSFLDRDGRLAGFDVEFALRLAAALGRTARFVLRPDANFDRELRNGTVDIVVDNEDDPAPRAGIAFSAGYMDADMKVLVAEADPALGRRAAARMLDGTSFGMTDVLIPNPRIRLFANGFLNTVSLFVLAALFGFLLIAKAPGPVRRALAALVWVPPVVTILLFHEALLPFLPPSGTAVLALALVFAARRAARPDEPSADAAVSLLQWTAVVGMLDVFDLTMAADLVCGRSFAALVPMLGVALAYALLAKGVAAGIARWGRRAAP